MLTGTAGRAQDVTAYVRYECDGNVSYGILVGEIIHELRGDIFESVRHTGNTVPLDRVRLLTPTAPRKVIAVGFNYKSHLSGAPAAECLAFF